MNLSGSSSSLTSDASTKAGTVSLRSYGIGGAFLHKKIQLITSQQSRGRSGERCRKLEEEDEEKGSEMEKEKGERIQYKRGRFRQQISAQSDSGVQKVRAGRIDSLAHNGCPPGLSGLGPMSPSPLSQPHKIRAKPSESPLRTRLMSPFRILRGKSQSRERPMAVRPQLNGGERKEETPPSSEQDKTQGENEERVRRSASPNPFLWLCKVRRIRRKTV